MTVLDSAMNQKRFSSSNSSFGFGTESEGSSEEIDSPKSARNLPMVHLQVLKIREEDSHIGEDIAEGISKKEKLDLQNLRLRSHVNAFMLERPILPSSPLSGKRAVGSCH